MRRNWIKLYVDQCLRGSMIAELLAAQRWQWVGFLLLGGDSSVPGVIFRRKDENGSLVGYSDITLAEMLDIDLALYRDGVRRMIEKEKISVNEKGVITILNWNKYQSEYQRQKPYRDDGYKKGCNEGDALEREREGERDREGEKNNGRKSGPLSESEIDEHFEKFWKAYPAEGRHAKQESKRKFAAICKRGEMMKLSDGLRGYEDFLKSQKIKRSFDQRPMYAKTFLNGRWAEFVGYKYEPPL
jgi:hypothetical protein